MKRNRMSVPGPMIIWLTVATALALTACLVPRPTGTATPPLAQTAQPAALDAMADWGTDEILDPGHALYAGRPQGFLTIRVRWPEALTRRLQGFPATTRQFKLTVTSGDLPQPIVATLNRTTDAATESTRVSVPAGIDRTLKVEGLNASGKVVASVIVPNLIVEAGKFTAVTAALATRVGIISGTVLSGRSGNPEAGVEVGADGYKTLTDASGSFILPDVTPGRVSVALTKLGLYPTSVNATVTAGGTVDLGSQTLPVAWRRQLTTSMNDLKAVYFVDANVGWAVGTDRILKTADGGKNWFAQSFSTGYAAAIKKDFTGGIMASWTRANSTLNSVRFIDSLVGYALGDSRWAGFDQYCGNYREISGSDPIVLRTSDGGQSWTSVAERADEICASSFPSCTDFLCRSSNSDFFTEILPLSETDIRFAGTVDSLYSSDGATTFSSKAPAVSNFYVSSTTGWRAKADGGIAYTNNGGASWSDQVLPSGIGKVLQMRFTDAYTGTAMTDTARVIATSDGGANWTVLRTPSQTLNLARFTYKDDSFGWAVDTDGNAWVTKDLGQTWQKQLMADPDAKIRGVHFVDPDTAWAVGDGGRIYRY